MIMRALRILSRLCFVVPLLALSGCQTTTETGAVGAERQQFMLVSSEELDQIAAQAYTKLSVWRKMLAANQGGSPPEFLSTYPAESSRIEEIESLLPNVVPLYEAARR